MTRNLRIRRCTGNRNAWTLIVLRADGTEANSFGSYTTSMSIDGLLAGAGHLAPTPQDHVEFICA